MCTFMIGVSLNASFKYAGELYIFWCRQPYRVEAKYSIACTTGNFDHGPQ